jgi:prolyl-tRNA synthetase
MFDITVEDPQGSKEDAKPSHIHVWQNSWGLSTRVIGVMVMIHGDDKGLVMPPMVANEQVVIVPVGINKNTTAEAKEKLYDELHELKTALRQAGIRADYDIRDGYTPAWKFNDHELKGVPVRLEYGPKDAEKKQVVAARRDSGAKTEIPIATLAADVRELLDRIQQDMYAKAEQAFREHRVVVHDWAAVVPALDAKNVVLIPSCLEARCEEKLKELTTGREEAQGPADKKAPSMGMKSLCVPFEQPAGLVRGTTKCLNPQCDALAREYCMYGRSY